MNQWLKKMPLKFNETTIFQSFFAYHTTCIQYLWKMNISPNYSLSKNFEHCLNTLTKVHKFAGINFSYRTWSIKNICQGLVDKNSIVCDEECLELNILYECAWNSLHMLVYIAWCACIYQPSQQITAKKFAWCFPGLLRQTFALASFR